MNYTFILIAIIGFMAASAAGIFVLARSPRNPLNRIFFGYSIAMAFACLSEFLLAISATPERAGIYNHLSTTFWVIFVILLLWFCSALARIRSKAVLAPALALLISLGALLVYYTWKTNWFYLPPVATGWGMAPRVGERYSWFAAYSVAMIVLSLILLFYAWRSGESRLKRKQAQIIFFGLSAGVMIGLIFDVILPGYYPPYPSSIPAAMIIYTLSFSFAMIKYGLLVVTPGVLAERIIHLMPNMLVFVDAGRRIVIANDSLSDILGYSREEVAGQPCALLYADEAACKQAYGIISQRGVVKEQNIILKKKDGGSVPVILAGSAVKDAEGEAMGTILIFQDISKEQKLIAEQRTTLDELTKNKRRMLSILEDVAASREETKKMYDDLKTVDKMKTEFLSVISHELRTPLTPIVAYISMFLSETFGKMDPKYLKAAEVIKKQTEHLISLIDNILDVSRIERGKSLSIKKEPMLLRAAIADLLEAMKFQYNERQIKVQLELPDDFPTIQADPNKIDRVLTNLLGNALKFTPRGGEIKINGKKEEGAVLIKVMDNGVGIAPENLERIFNRFYQADSTYTREAGGVGLGLSIVREIINEHGGRVWAESKGLGMGTAICFTLPI